MPPVSKEDLPDPIKRSLKKAPEALGSKHERSRPEQTAHRFAYASLKLSFERPGDHWRPKKTTGPSDGRERRSGG